MKECMIYGLTLPEVYHNSLIYLQNEGEIVDCPDYNTEQKEISMTMVVEYPLMEPMISCMFIGGPKDLERYRLEMVNGIMDWEIYNNKWKYTYHNRMCNYKLNNGIAINQLSYVIDVLKANPYSRRAVIDIRDINDDMNTDDPACLQHMQLFIRNGRLNLTALFRSNDACKAAFMNMFALIMIQKYVADALGVTIGSYTHRSNSYHCYKRDYGLLEGYNKRLINSDGKQILTSYNTTYFYEGDWKEEMDNYRLEILNEVEELKKRDMKVKEEVKY